MIRSGNPTVPTDFYCCRACSERDALLRDGDPHDFDSIDPAIDCCCQFCNLLRYSRPAPSRITPKPEQFADAYFEGFKMGCLTAVALVAMLAFALIAIG